MWVITRGPHMQEMFGGARKATETPGVGDTDEAAPDVARSKQLQAEQPAGAKQNFWVDFNLWIYGNLRKCLGNVSRS